MEVIVVNESVCLSGPDSDSRQQKLLWIQTNTSKESMGKYPNVDNQGLNKEILKVAKN